MSTSETRLLTNSSHDADLRLVRPLPSEGGFLDTDGMDLRAVQDTFDELAKGSEIVRVHDLETISTKDGTIRRLGMVTRAGYAYAGMVGIPSDQQSDVAVIGTSAWWTSDRGHNEHTGRNVMRQGSPFLFLGAEGSYRDSELVVPRQKITLARSAAAVLRFAGEIGSEYPHIIHPSDRHAIGESRGAMVGMGLVSPLDSAFEQNVMSADLTAPCFPRKGQLRDLREVFTQLYGEVRGAKSLIGKIATNVFAHYPSTIDLNPYSFLHQLGIGPALLSGDAGKMAQLIEPEKVVHITTFQNDLMSMRSDWEDIFDEVYQGSSNVRITPLEGAHITIADPETLAYIRARLKAVQVAHAAQGSEFTGTDVFDRAHEYVEEILCDVLKHKASRAYGS